MTSDPLASRRLDLPVAPASIDQMLDALDELWAEVPEVAERDRHRLATALGEVLGNVAQHAGRPDDDAPQAHLVTVHLDVAEDVLGARVRDAGRPLGVDPGAAAMPSADAEGGRGLPLVHALADEVDYARRDGQNVWSLTFRRAP